MRIQKAGRLLKIFLCVVIILNLIASIASMNISAICGWLVALLFAIPLYVLKEKK